MNASYKKAHADANIILKAVAELPKEIHLLSDAHKTLSDKYDLTNRKVKELTEEKKDLLHIINHLKANHAELVAKNAILRQRPDLPVDRIPAIKALDEAYEKINELTKENEELKCQLQLINQSKDSK